MNGKNMTDLADNKCNIRCEWMETKRGLVNYDGQVYPCCYFANNFSVEGLFGDKLGKEEMRYGGIEIKKGDKYVSRKRERIYQDYLDSKSELNVMNSSLSDILNHEWFSKKLPESWNDESTAHRLCKKFCQVGSDFKIDNKTNKDE